MKTDCNYYYITAVYINIRNGDTKVVRFTPVLYFSLYLNEQ